MTISMTEELAETEELIDHRAVEELRESMGPDAFADIAATFCDQVALLVGRFVRAAAAADSRQMNLAAHELIGLAGTVGAPRLAALGRRAMACCRNEPEADCTALADAIDSTATATLEAFRPYV